MGIPFRLLTAGYINLPCPKSTKGFAIGSLEKGLTKSEQESKTEIMLSRTHIVIIFKDGRDASPSIDLVNKLLTSEGFSIEVGELYYLNDINNSNNDPEVIISGEECLNKIKNWPTSGWIHYSFRKISFLVSFLCYSEGKIGGIFFSAFSNQYSLYPEELDRFFVQLFHKLNGVRIIRGDDLFENFEPEDEMRRVQSGIFEGKFDLDLSVN
ncbi:MAG: hypothetical protein H6581_20875 [Bacteroidia bacterium]|nr:hypothetical protein [Bacteroidia bacterium]